MALTSLSIFELFSSSVVLIVLWISVNAVYNLYLHPLRSFPGPLSHRVSILPWCYRHLRGTLEFNVLKFHEKYGPVVRISPSELALNDASAWKDVMGHKIGDFQEMEKYMPFYRPVANRAPNVINAGREEHSQLRRTLAHGFSDRSMKEQAPLIGKYIDLLITRLHQYCGDGPLDLAAWYNFTTFDIIGDLAFGEPFGCLEKSSYHPWVKLILGTAKVGTVLQTLARFPRIKTMLLRMVPKSMMEEHAKHFEQTKAKLLRRMEMEKGRPDLMEGLLKKKDDLGLDLGRLQENSSLLVIAGSETTATLLAGLTFLLLSSPEALTKVRNEVRSAFSSQEEIDIISVTKLEYLLACIEEALRMYPPVPTGLPRVVPPGGATVSGYNVPENTVVAIHQWATYHSDINFAEPFVFHPERFLGDPAFANDRREALQPFHLGPRNCLGRNLAYTEIRLIMARLLFNFDLRLADESRGWLDQKIFNFWNRGPLSVHLTPATPLEAAGEGRKAR